MHDAGHYLQGEEMKVAELMKTEVKTIASDALLADAIAVMLDANLSALPVLDQDRRPVGMVTLRDILATSLGREGRGDGLRGPGLIEVAEVMSPWPPWVDPDTSVSDAAKMMSYLDLKRVFVVDRSTVVGVFSQTDVVDALATTTYARRA
jgi:CBS domain-containing protein